MIVVLLVSYTVLAIFLGIYAYGNEDPSNCWYIEGVDTPGRTIAAVQSLANKFDVPIKPGYPVDVARMFHFWFLWGFWGSVGQVILTGIAVPLFLLTS